MYYFNIQKLKEDFRSDDVSEADGFKYFFLQVIIIALIIHVQAILGPSSQDLLSRRLDSFLKLLSLGGILHVYRCNGGAMGTQFVQRFIALHWVLVFRFLIPFMLVLLVLGKVKEAIPIAYWADPAISFIMLVMLYWRLGVHCREIAEG